MPAVERNSRSFGRARSLRFLDSLRMTIRGRVAPLGRQNNESRSATPSTWRSSSDRNLVLDRRFVPINQIMQVRAHGREIVFPTPFACARWKVGIALLHFLFKVHTHPCHYLEILHHSPTNSVGDGVTLCVELLQSLQQPRLEVRIVHVHEEIGVTT